MTASTVASRPTRGLRGLVLAFFTGAAIVLVAPAAYASCHEFTFSQNTYSVSEGAGSVTITVKRDGNVEPSSIQYQTASGVAKPGTDFLPKNGKLYFNKELQLSFSVPIVNDAKTEPTESFRVVLDHPDGCRNGPAFVVDDPSIVSIADNDPKAPDPPKPSSPGSGGPGGSQSGSPQATPAATPTFSVSPSPSPSPTGSGGPRADLAPVALGDPGDGGLSGGAVAGIVGATIVLGGAAAIWVRRRFLIAPPPPGGGFSGPGGGPKGSGGLGPS